MKEKTKHDNSSKTIIVFFRKGYFHSTIPIQRRRIGFFSVKQYSTRSAFSGIFGTLRTIRFRCSAAAAAACCILVGGKLYGGGRWAFGLLMCCVLVVLVLELFTIEVEASDPTVAAGVLAAEAVFEVEAGVLDGDIDDGIVSLLPPLGIVLIMGLL